MYYHAWVFLLTTFCIHLIMGTVSCYSIYANILHPTYSLVFLVVKHWKTNGQALHRNQEARSGLQSKSSFVSYLSLSPSFAKKNAQTCNRDVGRSSFVSYLSLPLLRCWSTRSTATPTVFFSGNHARFRGIPTLSLIHPTYHASE